MEFECDKTSYDIIEFHDKFKDNLPKYVKIYQGYHGDIAENIFSTGEMIRIQAVSHKKRVLAKFKSPEFQKRLFSYPSSYFENLCVVKQGRVGREKFLFEILNESELPLTVRYPKNRIITGDGVSVNTNTIPEIELLETFDECYMLGNIFTGDDIFADVVYLPLYYPEVRLSVVTGIKGQSIEKWNRFCKDFTDACAYVDFDQEYGNQEIAEHSPEAINSASSFTYVAPLKYSTISSIVKRSNQTPVRRAGPPHFRMTQDPTRNVLRLRPKVKYSDAWKKLDRTQSALEKRAFPKRDKLPRPPQPDNVYEEINEHKSAPTVSPTKLQSFISELDTKLQTSLAIKTHTGQQECSAQQKKHLPSLPPPPKPLKPFERQQSAPELPQRDPKQLWHKPPGQMTHHYSNDVPRTHIQPTVQFYGHMHETDKVEHQYVAVQDQVETANVASHATEPLANVANRDDVSKLTIGEVGSYLRKLGLGKFENLFREHMIDGSLLVDLDKGMLMEDFGMKGVEALLLTKFAQEGHMPV